MTVQMNGCFTSRNSPSHARDTGDATTTTWSVTTTVACGVGGMGSGDTPMTIYFATSSNVFDSTSAACAWCENSLMWRSNISTKLHRFTNDEILS